MCCISKSILLEYVTNSRLLNSFRSGHMISSKIYAFLKTLKSLQRHLRPKVVTPVVNNFGGSSSILPIAQLQYENLLVVGIIKIENAFSFSCQQ